MKSNLKRWYGAIAAVSIIAGFMAGSVSKVYAENSKPDDIPKKAVVIPPNAKAYGMTYGEWSARWWQWAVSLPLDHNPLADTADCSTGQLGSVWFLGGSFVSSTAERNCTVPPGKALFFPIINTECSTLEVGTPWYGSDAGKLPACVRKFSYQDVYAEIDGVAVPNLDRYLVESPLFTFAVPPANVLGVAPGTGQSVSKGYHLMLAPLSVGNHVIHFRGTITSIDTTAFTLYITYHLTVAPPEKP